MQKFCNQFHEIDNFYVRAIVPNPDELEKKELKLAESYKIYIKVRNCNIITGDSEYALFVTAPPKLDKYEPVQNRILVFLHPINSNLDTIMPFSIVVDDFEGRFPALSKFD